MKSKIIFIFLFCAQSVWAQNNIKFLSEFTKLEKIIPFTNLSSPELINNLKYCTFENEIFFTVYNSNTNSDSLLIYDVSCNNFEIDSNYLFIPHLSNELKIHLYPTINFIEINEKWIVIGTFDKIYIFSKQMVLIKQVENHNYFDYAGFLSTDILLLGVNYNFGNKRIKNSALTILDVNKATVLKTLTPFFNMIQYSGIWPNHWIDVCGNKILFSQTTEYHIDIYDSELNLNSGISETPAYWIKMPQKKSAQIIRKKLTGIYAIQAILPYEDSITRIEQVFFVNDSLIMVYRKGIKNINYFDFWKFIDKKWVLNYTDYIDRFSEGIITMDNYPLFASKSNKSIAFSKNFLVSFSSYAPVNPFGLLKSEYLSKVNNYFYDKSPCILLYIYSYNFDL